MRQKKIKNLTKEHFLENGVYIEAELIDKTNIFLEIGSGKGAFISSLAIDNVNNNYFALEKQISVCYRILEKKRQNSIDNLYIILDDASNLDKYFKEHSIDCIYLSFSDPWPKKKHHKRRLTYPNFLNLYKKLLKTDGIIQFRTDHEELFNDTITYASKIFEVFDINNDYQSDKYVSEYEIKLRDKKKIHQMKMRLYNESL